MVPPGFEPRGSLAATGRPRLYGPANARDAIDCGVITGYAAVFYDPGDAGTQTELYPGLVERIMPTAFDRCIREQQDCRALFNHNPDTLLARCSTGTLRLSLDPRGLVYAFDYDPADPDHQRVMRKLERGDVTGSSFSFNVRKQVWSIDASGAGYDVRELHDLDVYDVGPVTFPAYSATSAAGEMGDDPYRAFRPWQEQRARALAAPSSPPAIRTTATSASVAREAAERRRQLDAAARSLCDQERLRRLEGAERELARPAPFGFPVEPALIPLIAEARRFQERLY
jgi:HK97 family phage prohead protease